MFAEDSAASACPRAKQGRVSVVGGPRAEMSQNEVVSEGGSNICPESTRSHIVSIVSQIFIFYRRLKWGQPNVINHPERNTPVNLRESKENMQQVDLPHVWEETKTSPHRFGAHTWPGVSLQTSRRHRWPLQHRRWPMGAVSNLNELKSRVPPIITTCNVQYSSSAWECTRHSVGNLSLQNRP